MAKLFAFYMGIFGYALANLFNEMSISHPKWLNPVLRASILFSGNDYDDDDSVGLRAIIPEIHP